MTIAGSGSSVPACVMIGSSSGGGGGFEDDEGDGPAADPGNGVPAVFSP